MELPIQPLTLQVKAFLTQWMAPFLSTPSSRTQGYIMSLSQVERILHDYFVSMEPLTITYEYYDDHDQFHEVQETVYVHSTIDSQRTIKLIPIDGSHLLHISTEQILSVASTTGNLWP